MTDVRLDYALFARHACRRRSEISYEYECFSERSPQAGDQLDNGMLATQNGF